MKKQVLSIVAVIVGLLGVLWFLQGVGVLGGSFMSNQVLWAVIGTLMVIVALGIFFVGNRRTSI